MDDIEEGECFEERLELLHSDKDRSSYSPEPVSSALLPGQHPIMLCGRESFRAGPCPTLDPMIGWYRVRKLVA